LISAPAQNFLDIGTGAKCLRACARHDQRARSRRGNVVERAGERVDHRKLQCVVRVGPI